MDKNTILNYVTKTPGNTNRAVLGGMLDSISDGSGGGGDAEVWLVGDTGVEQAGMMTFVLSNVDATDHLTELAINGTNYKVFLNGEELPYFISDENGSSWSDTNDYSTMTKSVEIFSVDGTSSGMVAYKPASAAPTSVEVSVKTK